jgi:hypothetical protein
MTDAYSSTFADESQISLKRIIVTNRLARSAIYAAVATAQFDPGKDVLRAIVSSLLMLLQGTPPMTQG